MKTQPFFVIVGAADFGNNHMVPWIVCVCLAPDEAARIVGKLESQRDAFMKARVTFDKARKLAAQRWHARHGAPAGPGFITTSMVSYPLAGSIGVTFGVGGQTITAAPAVGSSMVSGMGGGFMSSPRIGDLPTSEFGPRSPMAQAEWKDDDEELRGKLRGLVTKLRMMDLRFPWVSRDLDAPSYTIEITSDDPHTAPGIEPERW